MSIFFFPIMMQIDFMAMDYGLLVKLPVVPAMENQKFKSETVRSLKNTILSSVYDLISTTAS